MFVNLIEDIKDKKTRFFDDNNNVIILWSNPRPKYLIVLGRHLSDGVSMYSAYVKTDDSYRIVSATGEELITISDFHFYEEELDIMADELDNSEVIGDILSSNLVESAVELEEFKLEYYLS